jgi:leucine dehydrogenase
VRGPRGGAGGDLQRAGGHLRSLCPRRASSTTRRSRRLQSAEIIAGAANNQLLLPEKHGAELERKGILYAPDFVANAGGVINVYSELAGWSSQRALRKADEIYETVLSVFALAKSTGLPTYKAADRVAEQRIQAVRGMMRTWPQYPNKES